MSISTLKYLGVAGAIVLTVALIPGCTEDEPFYCDTQINTRCGKVPGHYCDYEQRRCLPLEAGVNHPDGGASG